MPDQEKLKGDCSAALFKIRNRIHDLMGGLVEAPEQAGMRLLPLGLLQEASGRLAEAVGLLQGCAPDLTGAVFEEEQPYLPFLESYAEAVAGLVEGAPDPLPLPAGKASELVATHLNHAAWVIHQAATQLAVVQKKLKGCDIVALAPGAGAEVASYCEGAILQALPHAPKVIVSAPEAKTIKGKKRDWAYPTTIQHPLGLHKADIHLQEGEKGYRAILKYGEGDSHSWATSGGGGRLSGVRGRMELEGMGCEQLPGIAPTSLLACWGELSLRQLRHLAAFLSLLHNLDVVHKPYPHSEMARDAVWALAGELVEKHGEATYAAPQGQPDWGQLKAWWEGKKAQELVKGPLEDTVRFARFRDRHHELEEALFVTPVPISPVAPILKNAEEALAFLKERKWGVSNLPGWVEKLKPFNKAKLSVQEMKHLKHTGSPSDMAGHTIHNILNSRLHALGLGQPGKLLGRCGASASTGGFGASSAGMVSYCTRVLGQAQVGGEGNEVSHSFPPNQMKVYIDNDVPEGAKLPDGLYRVRVATPDMPDPLKGLVAQKLVGEGWVTYPSGLERNLRLGEVALLASFLSHLQGLAKELPPECLGKAVGEAAARAEADQDKGVLAHLAQPRFSSVKEVKAWCQKAGISVAATPEEKEVEKAVKGQATYRGCELLSLPTSKGELSYCSGVRRNPDSEVNARVTQAGIQHFYHMKKNDDLAATVSISPHDVSGGEGIFDIVVDFQGMYGGQVLPGLLKHMAQAWVFECKGEKCHRPLSKTGVRAVASFLSSLHHTWDIPGWCLPHALDHARKQTVAVSEEKGEEAWKEPAHPFTAQEWQEEVCSKVKPGAPPPEAEAPEGAPPVVAKPPFVPFQVGDQVTIKDKGVEAGIPGVEVGSTYTVEGFIGDMVVLKHPEVGGVGTFFFSSLEKVSPAKPEEVPYKLMGCDVHTKKAIPVTSALYCKGVKAEGGTILPVQKTHTLLGGATVTWDTKYSQAIVTLPIALGEIAPIGEALEGMGATRTPGTDTYTLPGPASNATHVALFLSNLDGIQDLPPDCWGKAVGYALGKAGIELSQKEPFKLPVFPHKPENWMKHVCELPSAPPSVPKKAPLTVPPACADAPPVVKALCRGVREPLTVKVSLGPLGELLAKRGSNKTLFVAGETSLVYAAIDVKDAQRVVKALKPNPALTQCGLTGSGLVKCGINPKAAADYLTSAALFLSDLDEMVEVKPECREFATEGAVEHAEQTLALMTAPWKSPRYTAEDWDHLCEEKAKPPEKAPPPPKKPIATIPGCTLLKGVSPQEVNEAVRTYCSGLYRHPTKGRSGIATGPSTVTSYMDTCRVEAQLTPMPVGKAKVSLAHKESTVMETPNWKARQVWMADRLAKPPLGLECSVPPEAPKSLQCSGVVGMQEVRLMATFLSSMGNLDKVKVEDPLCIAKAVGHVWDKAVEDQALAEIPEKDMSPYTQAEWEILCDLLVRGG